MINYPHYYSIYERRWRGGADRCAAVYLELPIRSTGAVHPSVCAEDHCEVYQTVSLEDPSFDLIGITLIKGTLRTLPIGRRKLQTSLARVEVERKLAVSVCMCVCVRQGV